MIDIDYLKQNNLIIFEGISGSKAYGLDTPESDTDIKGVFILPEDLYFGFEYTGQVNNATNDIVYFELRKFLDLLLKNNPNCMEMLNLPEECILYKNELYDRIKPEDFLSLLCSDTYAGYALSQIKKARGLKKKIVNPIDKEKKDVLDFCFVTRGFGSVPVKKWLETKKMNQEQCGLNKLNHFKDSYALFFDPGDLQFEGIVKSSASFDVCLSRIPADMEPETYLYFNKDGYNTYLRDYAEYWNWVKNRNEERYKSTITHGKNYDAKNMMHTFRLLAMAEEIARFGELRVKRTDREELLAIKKGDFSYDELVNKALESVNTIKELFEKSTLPQSPDSGKIERLLVSIRKDFYLRK